MEVNCWPTHLWMQFQSCICTIYSLECPNVIIYMYTQDAMVAVGLCNWMTHTFTSSILLPIYTPFCAPSETCPSVLIQFMNTIPRTHTTWILQSLSNITWYEYCKSSTPCLHKQPKVWPHKTKAGQHCRETPLSVKSSLLTPWFFSAR